MLGHRPRPRGARGRPRPPGALRRRASPPGARRTSASWPSAGAPARSTGVLLDLGVSSPQLDEPERGFSFQADGPLDMRMGAEGETAAELIERLDERRAGRRHLRRWARSASRGRSPAASRRRGRKTTCEAVEAVKAAVPRKAWPKEHPRRHPHLPGAAHRGERRARAARRRRSRRCPAVLAPGGVAAIISFHSLEDRAVKQAFKRLSRARSPTTRRGGCRCCRRGARAALRGADARSRSSPPTPRLQKNPRARSAKLRAVEKVSMSGVVEASRARRGVSLGVILFELLPAALLVALLRGGRHRARHRRGCWW